MNSTLQLYQHSCFERVFTPAECLAILALKQELVLSPVYESASGDNSIHKNVRHSSSFYLNYQPQSVWLYRKITAMIHQANQLRYQFDIETVDHVQIIQYEVGDFFILHTDIGGRETARRKLTFLLFLSDPSSYQGGELIWWNGKSIEQVQGTALVFPAYIPHAVNPVLAGVRHTLIAWVYGPPFR